MSKSQPSQGGLRRRPWHNLRLYLHEATLPDLTLHDAAPKLEGPKAPPGEYLLSPEADPRYRLRNVIRYKQSVMNRRVVEFCDQSIPTRAISNPESIGIYVRTALIGLPAKSFPGIKTHIPTPPIGPDDLLQWVMVPLLAAERIMNLVWPEETKGFAYTTVAQTKLSKQSCDPDFKLYRPVWWRNTDDAENEGLKTSSHKLVILSFLHCVLAPGDMQDFIGISEFPAFQIPLQGTQAKKLSRAEKIWAKVYDECTIKNCPFFVVTVYNAWIFGIFADGFRKAVTSYVIHHTVSNPNVLEWLIYWMASAHQIKGSYLRGPRHFEHADFSRPENVTERRSAHIPENVHDWPDQLITIDKPGVLMNNVDVPRTWLWNFVAGQ